MSVVVVVVVAKRKKEIKVPKVKERRKKDVTTQKIYLVLKE